MARATFVRNPETVERVDRKAAVYAGLIAGVVFMALELMMSWFFPGGSPWALPRMTAAIALGRGVLPPPATFDPGIVATGMVVHFVLSVVLGFVLAALLRNFKPGAAIPVGALFGLVVYLINYYPVAAMFFPWFEAARNWVSVLNHIVFGAVLAGCYLGFARH